jgi:hypothetical protein
MAVALLEEPLIPQPAGIHLDVLMFWEEVENRLRN